MNVLKTAEALAAEVATRVKTCTVAQGSETDLGVSVFEGRRKVSDDMIPCAVVIEADDKPLAAKGFTLVEVAQRFVVFAYVPCDPANPNAAARAAIRDLKRAIFRTNGRPDPRWGGTVREVEYLGRDIGPRADGAAFVVAAVEFSVQYVEDLSAP